VLPDYLWLDDMMECISWSTSLQIWTSRVPIYRMVPIHPEYRLLLAV
jgi:hypothetical protein